MTAYNKGVFDKNIYDKNVRRAMAIACFLFPLLFALSAMFFVIDPGEFVTSPDAEWIGGNDVERFGIAWLALASGTRPFCRNRLAVCSLPVHFFLSVSGAGWCCGL